MQIVAEHSFNNGKAFLQKLHKSELEEVKEVISTIVDISPKTKISREKTTKGKVLNKEIRRLFEERVGGLDNMQESKLKPLCPRSLKSIKASGK